MAALIITIFNFAKNSHIKLTHSFPNVSVKYERLQDHRKHWSNYIFLKTWVMTLGMSKVALPSFIHIQSWSNLGLIEAFRRGMSIECHYNNAPVYFVYVIVRPQDVCDIPGAE